MACSYPSFPWMYYLLPSSTTFLYLFLKCPTSKNRGNRNWQCGREKVHELFLLYSTSFKLTLTFIKLSSRLFLVSRAFFQLLPIPFPGVYPVLQMIQIPFNGWLNLLGFRPSFSRSGFWPGICTIQCPRYSCQQLFRVPTCSFTKSIIGRFNRTFWRSSVLYPTASFFFATVSSIQCKCRTSLPCNPCVSFGRVWY